VLVLSGSGDFAGGAYVVAGTLQMLSPTSLLDGSSLTVGGGAATAFGRASPIAGESALRSSAGAISAQAGPAISVPEPSALAFLAVGALAIGVVRHGSIRRYPLPRVRRINQRSKNA
jgi:hypothetical protein